MTQGVADDMHNPPDPEERLEVAFLLLGLAISIALLLILL